MTSRGSRYGAALPLLVLAALGLAAPAAADDTLNTDRDTLVRERSVNAGIAEALRRSGRIAAGRATRPISPRQAVMTALQENITLRRGELLPALADEALREAQAVFDPILSLSLTSSRSDTRHRISYGLRYRSGTIEVSPGVDDCPSDSSNTTPCYRIYFGSDSAVRYIEYDQPRAAGYTVDDVEASSESPGDEAITGATTANLTQTLPWGMQIDLGLELKYQDAYWVNNADSPQETSGAYGRAWSADSSLAISTPLPFAKNFGIGNDGRLTEELARMETEAQRWQLQVVLNETLQSVDLAFWSLAGAARRVDSARASLALAETLAARVQRLYRTGSVTKADLDQVNAQVASMKATLAGALGGYLTASNELQALIRVPAKELLQPVGYAVLLDQVTALPPVDVVTGHPQLLRSAVAVRQARLVEATRQRQTNLDVNAYVSVSGRQSDSAFGFADPAGALGRLHDPDYVTLQAAVAVRYPLNNRLAEATLRRAEADREINDLAAQQLMLELRQSYQAELAGLDAARAQAAIAVQRRALAEDLFQRAQRLFDLKQVGAVELTQMLLDVLNARLAHDEAQVQVKQAETRALGSAGLLPALYGVHTSLTPIDKVRLDKLAKSRKLRHFGDQP